MITLHCISGPLSGFLFFKSALSLFSVFLSHNCVPVIRNAGSLRPVASKAISEQKLGFKLSYLDLYELLLSSLTLNQILPFYVLSPVILFMLT